MQNLLWFPSDEDEEVVASLHRWNWLLDHIDKRDLVDHEWCYQNVVDWIRRFGCEENRQDFDARLRWEAYTAGERVSNIIVYYHFAMLPIPSEILGHIRTDLNHVSKNLEYNCGFAGNHVLNNARALYIGGCALNHIGFKEVAQAIIRASIDDVVSQVGFIIDGSSHYQFLVTRWLLEIYVFAEIYNDRSFAEFIKIILKPALESCDLFLVSSKKTNQVEMVLFGDISPDRAPNWLKNITSSKAAYHITGGRNSLVYNTPGWNAIFDKVFDNHLSCFKVINQGKSESTISSRSFYWEEHLGWSRIDGFNWVLFTRVPKQNTPMYFAHAHSDIGSLVLYYNGKPLLIDPGRKNYNKNDSLSEYALQPFCHNGITVNGEGLVPIKCHHFIQEFTERSGCISVKFGLLDVEVAIVFQPGSGFQYEMVKRTISLSNKKCVISDEIIVDGLAVVNGAFQFDSRFTESHMAGETFTLESRGDCEKVEVITNGRSLRSKLKHGGSFGLGWQSTEYNKTVKCFAIGLQQQGRGVIKRNCMIKVQ